MFDGIQARHGRRLAWLLAAVLAGIGLRSLYLRLPEEGDQQAFDRQFLGGQTCSEVQATLRVEAERLMLRGTLRAKVRTEGPLVELRFLLHHSLRLDGVRIGTVFYEEVDPLLSAAVSSSRDHRRLVAEVDEIDGHELPSDGEVEIHFQGSALPLRSVVAEDPLPLSLAAHQRYLPVLSAEGHRIDLSVELPAAEEAGAEWSVFTDAKLVEDGYGVRLEMEREGLPGLVLGPLMTRSYVVGRDRNGVTVDVATRRGPFPLEVQVKRAVEIVREYLSELLPDRICLLFEDSPALDAPLHLGGRLVLAPTPRSSSDLVRILASAALPEELRQSEVGRSLPSVVALLSASPDEDLNDGEQRLRQGVAGEVRFVEAWQALKGSSRSVYARRAVKDWVTHWVATGELTELRFEDEADRLVMDWATRRGGVDVYFDDVQTKEVNKSFDLTAVVRVEPPPPAGVEPPSLRVVVVTASSEVQSLPVRWEGGVGVARKERIDDAPIRVILDPREQFPDRDRTDNVYSLLSEPEPAQFACNPVTTRLALVPSVLHKVEKRPYGLYLYDLDPVAGPEYRDWYELPARVSSMRWIDADRHLFLQFAPGVRERFGLLDLEAGRLRRFEDDCEPGPGGRGLLLNRESAPGRWRHGVYDVARRRVTPLLNDLPGALAWVEGNELVRGSSPRGLCQLLDLEGTERGSLGVAAEEVRDVRYSPRLGFTFVTEHAQGSVLWNMLDDGIADDLFRASGRLLDYDFSPDPGDIEIFTYVREPDGGYAVHRVRSKSNEQRLLWRGRSRPVPGLHLPSGVLVSDSRDRRSTALLEFVPFPRGEAAEVAPIRLADEVFLDPAPTLSSAGRYLYFLRIEGAADDLPDAYRRRALYRFDFLADREEPVFTRRG